MSPRARNLLPTIRTVHLLLAPALIFISANLDRQYQTDFWHHLARGQQIVGHGRLVDVDLFTFTRLGAPLRDANWLMQVMYWRLFSWGGLELVQVVNAGLLAMTLAVLAQVCWFGEERGTPAERGANGRKAPSTRIVAIVGAAVFLGLCPFALIRPQTGSFLLFVLLLGLLMRGGRARWLAVPIMALWANVHGGFAIGLLLIGAFCLAAGIEWLAAKDALRFASRLTGEKNGDAASFRARKLAASPLFSLGVLLGLSAGATGLNPYGWGIYQYATAVTARAAGRGIEEWLPPTLASAGGWVLLLWLGGLAVAAWIGRRRPCVVQVCLLVCFVPMALRSVRMVPWVLLATAPMMAEMLATAGGRLVSRDPKGSVVCPGSRDALPFGSRLTGGDRPSFPSAMLLVILLGAAVMSLPWLAKVNPLFGTVRSNHRVEDDLQGAKMAMDQRGPGRVFTRLEWGDYLSFAAHGEDPVFCDGRIELYPDALWKQYLQVSAGRGDFERIFDRWAVDYLVIDAQYHATLLEQIGRNGSWKTVWRSGQVVLLTRTVPLVAANRASQFPAKTIADTR